MLRTAIKNSIRLNGRRFMATAGKYDLVVIGGGPGGYVAAIRAGQLGMKVACVESRGKLGGTCLNVGCIPSKALLNASHKYYEAKNTFSKFGVDVGEVKFSLEKMMKQKTQAVDGLTKGIEFLFSKNKVQYVKGTGKITKPNEVTVSLNGGGSEVLQTDKILIATGSEASTLPNVPVDEKRIVTSTGALSLSEVPKNLVVIGGGVIGLEMGSVYGRLGAKVHVVEFLDRIVPGMDAEVATNFQRILAKQKFSFQLGAKVTAAKNNGKDVSLTVVPVKGGAEQKLTADVVLVATGRRPYTAGLGLEGVGVQTERGQVKINAHFQTNVPSIYAIGDVVRGPMLAHKAEDEGLAAVELMAGKDGHVNYNAIPGVVYTHPEVGTIGKTEEDLKAAKIKYRVQKFPFQANSRARTVDDAEGFVKILSDAQTKLILGIHIIGPNAGEMIGEGVLALEYGATTDDIARSCHAHPTLSEAFREACMDKPIHFA